MVECIFLLLLKVLLVNGKLLDSVEFKEKIKLGLVYIGNLKLKCYL